MGTGPSGLSEFSMFSDKLELGSQERDIELLWLWCGMLELLIEKKKGNRINEYELYPY